ncbi:MAG: hypothetical protein K6G80_11925 [Treponema sp.]|nr:hypothetical protein [Treponema sp.]
MKGFILSIIGNVLLIDAAAIGKRYVVEGKAPDSFISAALVFLILACEVLLTALVFSIVGLAGNKKRNERKLFNVLGIILSCTAFLVTSAVCS